MFTALWNPVPQMWAVVSDLLLTKVRWAVTPETRLQKTDFHLACTLSCLLSCSMMKPAALWSTHGKELEGGLWPTLLRNSGPQSNSP